MASSGTGARDGDKASLSSSEDEFYDAEDGTPVKKVSDSRKPAPQVESDSHDAPERKPNPERAPAARDQMESMSRGRKKFRELRQCMQTEDEDCGPLVNSTPDSQNSSAEGVFPLSKVAHPFSVIEHDTMSLQSLSSLGRIGKILGGSVDPSAVSVGRDGGLAIRPGSSGEACEPTRDPAPQEPDVIASTKANSLRSRPAEPARPIATAAPEPSTREPTPPVAPPRRKKKGKTSVSTPSLDSPDAESVSGDIPSSAPPKKPAELPGLDARGPTLNEIFRVSGARLPSPASAIDQLTREFQNSLDLAQSEIEKRNAAYLANRESLHRTVLDRRDSMDSDRRASPIDAGATKSTRSVNGLSSIRTRSLDVRSATKGAYVVKPQDEERTRGIGPSSEELGRANLGNDSSPAALGGNVGHSSLGSNRSPYRDKNQKERRKSAGDEDLLKQMNMFVRTRTDSGKRLTDMEILEQVTVLNLDTGERVPLSIAEDKLPQCINPLSLHIMRLTSEYVSNSSIYDDYKQKESDDDAMSMGGACSTLGIEEGSVSGLGASEGSDEQSTGGLKRKTAKLKRFFGSTVKKTMDKAKSIAQEVTHARHKEFVADIVDEVRGEQNIKLKASNSHKGPYDFENNMRHVQEFTEHVGPVWCMKFSPCGRLLATAGQDKVLRIWVIRDAYDFFYDMRIKYANKKSSPTPSQESLVSHPMHSFENPESQSERETESDSPCAPFMSKPFCVYAEHTSDLLDVSWSKTYFILSSSMDKTVRLWHISRKECLCCFLHIDFVTAIAFHPKDDRLFLSGSLDGKLRLWNIPDKKVALWNEIDGQSKLITAANFCLNGKLAVVGSYDGRCIFYNMADQLKYHTQIDVRSTRGKNSTGRKISGIEPMPGEDKVLITSNDSRIRLYDLGDLSLSCKYKGYANVSSQIKASFSHDGKYIVSGSENQCIYIWKTHHDYFKFTSVRRDRNDFWEGIKAHNAVVTCAVFAPNPENIIRMIDEREQAAKGIKVDSETDKIEDPMVEQHTKGCSGHVLVSADFNGCIKVFVNKTKPKHSSLPASALA